MLYVVNFLDRVGSNRDASLDPSLFKIAAHFKQICQILTGLSACLLIEKPIELKKTLTHPKQQQHPRRQLQHTPGTYPKNSTTRFNKSFHVIINVFWCTLGCVQRVCWNLLRCPQPTTATEHDHEGCLSFSTVSTSIWFTCIAGTFALALAPGIYDKNSSKRSGKTWEDLKISDLPWVWHSNTQKTKQKTSWFAKKKSTCAGDHSTYCFFNHGLFFMFNPKCIIHHIHISYKNEKVR